MRSACLRAWLALSMGWALGNCSPVSATPINGDFEDPYMSHPDVSLAMPGWTEVEDGTQQSMPGPNSSVGIVNPLPPHPAGTQPFNVGNWGFIQLANQEATEGCFYQSIGAVLPNKTYIISFDSSNIDSVNLGIFNPIDVRDPDTTVRVFFTLNGGASDFSQQVGTYFETPLDLLSAENDIRYGETISFTPTPSQVGSSLNIVFCAERPAGQSVYPSEVWFDNIQLAIQTNVVPEPHSMLLAGAGAGLLLIAGRIRRARRR